MRETPDDTLLQGRTPEGILYTLRPAGLFLRLLALILDNLFQGLLVIIMAMLFFPFIEAMGAWLFLLFFFLVQWFYHTFFELLFQGATPGKRITGLQVVMADGTPVQPGAAFLRNILRSGDAFLEFYHLGLITHLFSPGFRRLGDWAAGTLVVYKRSLPRRWGTTAQHHRPWLEDRPRVAPPRPLSAEEKEILIRFCERYPRLTPGRADEIALLLVKSFTEEEQPRQFPADYLLSLGAPLLGKGGEG